MFYTYEAVIRRSREQNRITTGIELVKPHFLLKLSLPFVFNSNYNESSLLVHTNRIWKAHTVRTRIISAWSQACWFYCLITLKPIWFVLGLRRCTRDSNKPIDWPFWKKNDFKTNFLILNTITPAKLWCSHQDSGLVSTPCPSTNFCTLVQHPLSSSPPKRNCEGYWYCECQSLQALSEYEYQTWWQSIPRQKVLGCTRSWLLWLGLNKSYK